MDDFVLLSVREQVDAVLREIRQLEGSEFAYPNSKQALTETKLFFETHRDLLAAVSENTDTDALELVCRNAFDDLKESIDLLGFLLRSTNVRNSFEMYGPMLRLSRKVLGEDTRLIISSEWYFSPFNYIGYKYLPGYVLIGLPATESSSPFLSPLAGHELGHTRMPLG